MGGMSIWHWLIVLVIVLLVFGTKRLPDIGKDLGDAVKGFKKGLNGEDPPADPNAKIGADSASTDKDKTSGQ